eukprot:3937896-Pleurochrysis_carterae.AAC.2
MEFQRHLTLILNVAASILSLLWLCTTVLSLPVVSVALLCFIAHVLALAPHEPAAPARLSCTCCVRESKFYATCTAFVNVASLSRSRFECWVGTLTRTSSGSTASRATRKCLARHPTA